MIVEPRKKAANAYRRKEGLLIRATTKQEKQCKVRSETNDPCLRPAVVEVRGVPFCEPCAREQEAYFTIGELTEDTRRFDERALIGKLSQMQRISRCRGVNGAYEPDAA
jgi:hypothetical protein